MGFAHSSHGFLSEPLIWQAETFPPLSQDHNKLLYKRAVGESVKRPPFAFSPPLFSSHLSGAAHQGICPASIFNRGWRRRSSLLPQTKQSSAGVVFSFVESGVVVLFTWLC